MTHPGVCEAAVVGVKDGVYGEEIKAFVVAKPGMQVTPQELNDHCCARLKRFKTPKDFTFVRGPAQESGGESAQKRTEEDGRREPGQVRGLDSPAC